jgi:isocitrate dehydrogenase
MENKNPSRKAGELDNRGSHFYLALYWAQALVSQSENAELQSAFTELANTLATKENDIISELNDIQGNSVELGGYYKPDSTLCVEAMCPSTLLNSVLAGMDS